MRPPRRLPIRYGWHDRHASPRFAWFHRHPTVSGCITVHRAYQEDARTAKSPEHVIALTTILLRAFGADVYRA